MFDYYKFLDEVSRLPFVSGFEKESAVKIIGKVSPFFDSAEYVENVGIVCRKAGKTGAPEILLDAHLDEVGMTVTSVREDGFVSFADVGGIDPGILLSMEVVICAKRQVRGVVISTPPHLGGERDKTVPAKELWIDTGIEDAPDMISVGDPISFDFGMQRLMGNRICSKGLDDKSCVAAIIAACHMAKEPYCNITAIFSVGEELSSLGAWRGAIETKPDFALVLDVNHAKIKGQEDDYPINLSSGCAISLSATCSRRLTREVIDTAKKKNIPYTVIAEASNTGTNANSISMAFGGVDTAVLSIPLKYMHTPCEVVDISDIDATARLVCEMIMKGTVSSARVVKG